MYKCKITPETTPKEEKELGKKGWEESKRWRVGGTQAAVPKTCQGISFCKHNTSGTEAERGVPTHTHTRSRHQIRVITLKIHTSG